MSDVSKWRFVLLACITAIFFCALFLLPQSFTVAEDTPGYLQALHVLAGSPPPLHFIPNRLLTTSLGLISILALSHLVGGILPAWYLINSACFFLIGFLSFALFRRIAQDTAAGCCAALLIAANYAMLIGGLTYLMDIGSWTLYVTSLFFLFRYIESDSRRDLFISAALAGLGGIWKEYAYLAFIPIACVLLWENRQSFAGLVKNAAVPALVAVLPTLIIHGAIYVLFRYTYFDWYGKNTASYAFSLAGLVKGFGVVLSLSALSALAGFGLFAQQLRKQPIHTRDVFLLSLLLPPLLLCVWPGLTERVMFLAVPTSAAYSALFFRQAKRWWFLMPFVVAYTCISFTTDHLLPRITLPF